MHASYRIKLIYIKKTVPFALVTTKFVTFLSFRLGIYYNYYYLNKINQIFLTLVFANCRTLYNNFTNNVSF